MIKVRVGSNIRCTRQAVSDIASGIRIVVLYYSVNSGEFVELNGWDAQ
jgi:hypothetical protein